MTPGAAIARFTGLIEGVEGGTIRSALYRARADLSAFGG